MNENENLYDMVKHSEAKFGRMGDTLIRQVDNEDAHVNAWEANLIDRYGPEGEALVKSVGSGSINPYTGNKEYNPWAIVGGMMIIGSLFNAGWKGQREHGGTAWWDYSLGKHGVGGWIGDNLLGGKAAKKKKAEARTIVMDGVTSLQDSYDAHMGSDGFFHTNQTQAFNEVSAESTDALQEIGKISDAQIGKADMASSGTVQYNTEINTDKVTRDYKVDVNDIVNQRREDQFNFLTDLKRQKNQLLTDYQQTIDEAYEGEFAFDDIVQDSLSEWDDGYSNPYDI